MRANMVIRPKKRTWYVGLVVILLTLLVFMLVMSCSGDDGNGVGPTSSGTIPLVTGNGGTYYVATNGDDANPGTEAQPWRTIQKAANTLGSGETVLIRGGTYQEQVVPQNSGVTYASSPGETAIIDGSGVSLPGDRDDLAGLFEVSDLSDIRISGLRIINAGPGDNHNGILIDNSVNITIDNNSTYNTASSGIGVWGSRNVIIDGNDVELCCNDGEQECITVAGTDTFEIRNNHVHNGGPGSNGGEGIDAKDGSSNGRIYQNHVHHLYNRLGIYIEAWDKHTYNIEVYRNNVHDITNASGFSVASEQGGLLENIRIYNNIAYNTELSGMEFSAAGDSSTHPMRDITVINNTFYNNGAVWGGGIFIENSDASGIVLRNNICNQNVLFQIAVEQVGSNLTIDHNLVDGPKGDFENDGANVVEGNPLFVSASGGNFRLQSGSPAIDAGSADGAPFDDYDGVGRPQGGGVDIGAFEQ